MEDGLCKVLRFRKNQVLIILPTWHHIFSPFSITYLKWLMLTKWQWMIGLQRWKILSKYRKNYKRLHHSDHYLRHQCPDPYCSHSDLKPIYLMLREHSKWILFLLISTWHILPFETPDNFQDCTYKEQVLIMADNELYLSCASSCY